MPKQHRHWSAKTKYPLCSVKNLAEITEQSEHRPVAVYYV